MKHLHSYIQQGQIDKSDSAAPYMNARREWSWMIGGTLNAKRNWQVTAGFSLLCNVLLTTGMITMALQTRYVPYVVQVDKFGEAHFAGLLTKQPIVTPALSTVWLRRFVTDLRSVIADPVAQKHQLDFVYQGTSSVARQVIDEYYREHNPFSVVEHHTVDVFVNSVLAQSEHTFQITWTETKRAPDGHIMGKQTFEGLFSLAQKTPSSPDVLNSNPLGFYITSLSWSERQ